MFHMEHSQKNFRNNLTSTKQYDIMLLHTYGRETMRETYKEVISGEWIAERLAEGFDYDEICEMIAFNHTLPERQEQL
jgi:hypothetical protein